MKLEKAKQWVKDHETEIKEESRRILYYSFGLGVGYLIGKKITDLRINHTYEVALRNCVDKGYMILTKPSENGEFIKLTASEWSEVMTETFKK